MRRQNNYGPATCLWVNVLSVNLKEDIRKENRKCKVSGAIIVHAHGNQKTWFTLPHLSPQAPHTTKLMLMTLTSNSNVLIYMAGASHLGVGWQMWLQSS